MMESFDGSQTKTQKCLRLNADNERQSNIALKSLLVRQMMDRYLRMEEPKQWFKMPKENLKPNPKTPRFQKADDKEQLKLFIEKARELAAEEDCVLTNKLTGHLAKVPHQPNPKSKKIKRQ
jgi:hypothetical protein